MRLGQAERGGGEPARTALAGVLFHALDVVHASGAYLFSRRAFHLGRLAKWANRNLSPDAVLVTPQQQRVRLAEQVLPATIPSVTHLSCDLTADHLAVSDPGAVAACGERPAARRVGDGR